MKTQAELVNRALALLLRFGEGESPSEDDIARVNALVGPVLAQLDADEIVSVNNPDEIDDHIYLPLARILANEAGPEFSVPYNEQVRDMAIMAIIRAVSVKAYSQPLATDYF